MKSIREYLKQNCLLFDGAVGTCYRGRYPERDPSCELANIRYPEDILMLHQEYLAAGAKALKTNTFEANTVSLKTDFSHVREILRAGWKLACEAAGDKAYVFADFGPIPENPVEYCRIALEFLDMGARHFLFETLPSMEGIGEACTLIREHCPDAFILLSFASSPDGFTRQGIPVRRLMQEASQYADAVGLNCISGPAHLTRILRSIELPVYRSIMPNSGYPSVVGGRVFFESGAGYFAQQMEQAVRSGVKILGGCCGTTPEHIAAVSKMLQNTGTVENIPAPGPEEAPARPVTHGRLFRKLQAGKKVIAVELDPPANADSRSFMSSAARLKNAGVDAITIADCPVARVRADSSMLAAKLHRELDIDPIPHMTCRDRNFNASKALLLGLAMEDVENILVVTGDPIPSGDRPQVRPVFNFNSAMLAGYIRALGEETLPKPFLIAGALNVNARNFDAELRKTLKKKDNGVQLLLTQPVFTEQAAENLRRTKEETGLWILGGLLPPVSYRNACYMHNEIAGIRLSDEILEQYRCTPPEETAELGLRLCLETAEKIAPYVDGYYLMPPFNRIGMIEELIEKMRRSPKIFGVQKFDR